jgi:hypothetical protein
MLKLSRPTGVPFLEIVKDPSSRVVTCATAGRAAAAERARTAR